VTKKICGVDVSSEWLDGRLGPQGEALRVENTAEGVTALVSFCREHGVELVVLEASGGYERAAFGLLWAQGLPCALANPRSVRRFAEAMGLLEKTDRIDAGVIAWYAEAKRLVAQEPASAAQQQLRALSDRLRQLIELAVAQGNQRRLVEDKAVQTMFDELLGTIRRQIRELERKIAELIEGDPLWSRLAEAFREIKGVAGRTVARLMAEMPEIGTLSGKAIGKLAGLAPLANDSGKHQGRRSIRGGREGVRSILFVVAEIVRRHDPDFAAFHRRLKDAGKKPKVVRIALARKLLVRLNAKARDVRTALALAA
jgi:transposase